MTGKPIHTIGHSNLDIDDFTAILRSFDIEVVVDVRAWPESRRNPQFGQSLLKEQLERIGIAYHWEGKSLGGHRKDSLQAAAHSAIRQELFRNYAAHMASEVFAAGLSRVYGMAAKTRIALMCAERDPASCHRSFISDRLAVDSWQVLHILGIECAAHHSPSEALRVEGGMLIYDRQSQLEFDGF